MSNLWAMVSSALRGRGAVAAVDGLCPAARAVLATRRVSTLPRATFPLPPLRPLAVAGFSAARPTAIWGADAVACANRAMSSQAAGFTQANIFAVAEIGGKQYKVTVNDSIVTENMVGRRVGMHSVQMPHSCICAAGF